MVVPQLEGPTNERLKAFSLLLRRQACVSIRLHPRDCWATGPSVKDGAFNEHSETVSDGRGCRRLHRNSTGRSAMHHGAPSAMDARGGHARQDREGRLAEPVSKATNCLDLLRSDLTPQAANVDLDRVGLSHVV